MKVCKLQYSKFDVHYSKLKIGKIERTCPLRRIEKLMAPILTNLNNNPQNIFLIDGFGAMLTAFMLFAILRPFQEYFGMPKDILTLLSLIALAFTVYSISCYFFLTGNWKPFLFGISIANFLYCCLTLGLVYLFHTELTGLGVAYFLAEVMLVMGLVLLEWRLISNSRRVDTE